MIVNLTRQKPDLSTLATLRGRWRQHPRYRGCVGHWLMVEGGGTTLYDISGSNLHGALHGAAWTVARWGPALRFNGTSHYVEVSHHAVLEPSAFTISASMVPDVVVASRRVLDKANNDGAFTAGYRIFTLNGPMVFQLNSTTDTYQPSETVAAGAWLHIAWSVGTTTSIYYNAQVTSINKTPVTSFVPATGAALYLGKFQGSGQFWDGVLDDIRLYNRVVAPEEIVSLYSQPFLEFAWALRQRQRVWVVPPVLAIPAFEASAFEATAFEVEAEVPIGPGVGSLMLAGIGR